MAADKVVNPRQRVLGTDFNLKKPLNGIAYPILGLAIVLTGVAFAGFLALNLFLPLFGQGVGRIPVVGDQLSQGANQPAPGFGA